MLFFERRLGFAVFLKVKLCVFGRCIPDIQRDRQRFVVVIVGDGHLGVAGAEGVQIGGEQFPVKAESLLPARFLQILQNTLLFQPGFLEGGIDRFRHVRGTLPYAVGGIPVRIIPAGCGAGG